MLLDLAYLAASLFFIFGLKDMSHPRTAVRGNMLGAIGMALAILTAAADLGTQLAVEIPPGTINYTYILAGLMIGSIVGVVLAYTVKMTGMPQMVALLNGFGGAASALVAGADLFNHYGKSFAELNRGDDFLGVLIATAATGVVGSVTFWGSLVAYAKLEEYEFVKRSWQYPHQRTINLGLTIVTVILCALLVMAGMYERIGLAIFLFFLVVVLSSILGVLLVNPIGGADMPVVIALLNSYSGIAGGLTGFVINNNVLIISGALVGASGIILSQIMCKAMNRSLLNVLFGVGAGHSTGPRAEEVYAKVRSTTAEDVALLLDGAQRVVFVPGYGMAVAQAQHAVRDLASALEAKGTSVEFAIHPVAGRMPGHMNVLLAEANISYDKLLDADAINPTLDTVDVAIVIGANDVVNPLAQTDPKSPIAGMPIIEVGKCHTVIVIKRSLSPGFAGIANPLFAADNTLMLFADGKDAVLEIVKELKNV